MSPFHKMKGFMFMGHFIPRHYFLFLRKSITCRLYIPLFIAIILNLFPAQLIYRQDLIFSRQNDDIKTWNSRTQRMFLPPPISWTCSFWQQSPPCLIYSQTWLLWQLLVFRLRLIELLCGSSVGASITAPAHLSPFSIFMQKDRACAVALYLSINGWKTQFLTDSSLESSCLTFWGS